MQRFDAVIFDMDGLLLDTERVAFEAFQAACGKLAIGDLSEVYKQCIGANEALGKSILENSLKGLIDFDEFYTVWANEYKEATKGRPILLKNGVEELLSHIEASKTPMAVATSSAVKRARKKLQHTGILNYFQHIIGGDQVERSKPDPEIYLKAASALSSSASKCLAIEDSANGVKAAVAAGMTVIQIPDLVYPDNELLGLGHIVLRSLVDILAYEFVN